MLSQLLLLVSAQDGKCPSSFECGQLGTIKFPFTNTQNPHCGILAIHGCDDPKAPKSIQLSNTPTRRFNVVYVESLTITIIDEILRELLLSKSCESFSNNFTLPPSPSSPFGSLYFKYNITLFRCNHSLSVALPKNFHNYTKCPGYNICYGPPRIGDPPNFKGPTSLTACSKVQLALKDESNRSDPFSFLSDEMLMEVQLSDACSKCIDHKRGQCQLDSQGKLYCVRGMYIYICKVQQKFNPRFQ